MCICNVCVGCAVAGTKVEPLTVSFHNLSFSIKQKKKKNDPSTLTPKVLLHPMSGVIKPGELLAVMGTCVTCTCL
jgi:hypothetical protein